MQYNPTNTTISGADTIYDVFLTINTAGYNGYTSGTAYIDSVLIKISSKVDLLPSSLIAAPGGAGAWTLAAAGLNAGGCQSGGDSGALCAQDGFHTPVGSTYTWEFNYATTGSLMTGSLASDIKVRYVDSTGNKVGALVSEGITLQQCTSCGVTVPTSSPEPASVAMLATVLIGAGFALKRRGSMQSMEQRS